MSEQKFYDAGWRQWESMIDLSPAPYHRRRIIKKFLKKRVGNIKSIADVGCGNGRLISEINKDSKNQISLSGFDISSSIIEKNKKRFSESKNITWNTLLLPDENFPEQYDAIVASEVLEHIDDWKGAFDKIISASKMYVVITVPSGRVFPIDKMMGHYRHFDKKIIHDFLKPYDVKIKMHYWGFPFHMTYKKLINLKAKDTYNQFASVKYGIWQKIVSTIINFLFYLNINTPFLSNQLIVFIEKK